MSTDEILAGLELVIVLAIACQLMAARVGLPAIVLLLPAGSSPAPPQTTSTPTRCSATPSNRSCPSG
jgi:hypothetical protein